MVEIVLATLGTYGIGVLLSQYDGPGQLFFKLRSVKLPKPLEGLLDCNVCISVYVAIAFAVGLDLTLVQYLAVVGGVIVLTRIEQ